MPKLAASPENTGPSSRAEATRGAYGRRLLLWVTALVAAGLGPVACLSDVPFPACFQDGTCASAGAGGAGAGSSSGGLGGTGGGGTAGGLAGSTAAGTAGTPAGGGEQSAGAGGGVDSGAGAEAGYAGEGGAPPAPPACDLCQIQPATFPAPCGTSPYSALFSVFGGPAPYAGWRVTAGAGSWHISPVDGSSATLTGTAAGPTTLTLEATDAAGERVTQSFSVAPRSSCWFAYTSLEGTDPELHLIDPILETPSPPTPLANNHGVYDFQFSPDGRYLAYRFGADATNPNGTQLALYDLSNWTEQVLTPDDNVVSAYAWSGDSSVLAIAFTNTSGVGQLGGVKLPTAAGAMPVALNPVPAFVDSNLYWIGTSYVAFSAVVKADPQNPGQFVRNPDKLSLALYAKLGSTGFQAPVTPNSSRFFYPGTVLQPSDSGFFMITSNVPLTIFNAVPPTDGAAFTHFNTNLVAPSGHFTAELATDQLKVFAAENGDGTTVVPAGVSAGPDCPMLLAWDGSQERIACVADIATPAHGEVRIFGLSSSATLSMSPIQGACVKPAGVTTPCGDTTYDYTQERASDAARAFSPLGKWFAFTTGSADSSGGNYLYWANLNNMTLARKSFVGDQNASTALAFSRDEHYILLQRGNALTINDLTAPQDTEPRSSAVQVSSRLLARSSQPFSACSESFPSDPIHFCGNANLPAPFSWSPDSRYAAVLEAPPPSVVPVPPPDIAVTDFTAFPGFDTHNFPAVDCAGKCAGQFAFQPIP